MTEDKPQSPEGNNKKQKITIVGTGQVGMTIAGLLAKRNRELIAMGRQGEMVEISILGRDENSASYKGLKENGITLNFQSPPGQTLHFSPDEFMIITTNPDEIKEQDHIFVATKTYSYSVPFFSNINKLKKRFPEKDQETTVILAQNGIPLWFLECTDELSKFYLESVDQKKLMLKEIGYDSIVGCILNFACNSRINEEGRVVYDVYTPINKIATPIGRPSNSKTQNVKDLHMMFRGAGIDFAVREGGIREDLWLKLQVNIAINALTTLYDCDIGALLADEGTRKTLETMASEINVVSKSIIGTELRKGDRLTDRLMISKSHVTSMRSDFNKNNPLEVSIYQSVLDLVDLMDSKVALVETVSQITKILNTAIANRDSGMTPDQARQSVRDQLDRLVDYTSSAFRPSTPIVPRRSPESSSGSESDGKKRSRKRVIADLGDAENPATKRIEKLLPVASSSQSSLPSTSPKLTPESSQTSVDTGGTDVKR